MSSSLRAWDDDTPPVVLILSSSSSSSEECDSETDHVCIPSSSPEPSWRDLMRQESHERDQEAKDRDLALAMWAQEVADGEAKAAAAANDAALAAAVAAAAAAAAGVGEASPSSSAIPGTTVLPPTLEPDSVPKLDALAGMRVLDPDLSAHQLFVLFDRLFFDQQLGCVSVAWSKRMTVCAGLCSYKPQLGLCEIKLSQALLKFRPRKDLVETLIHEMIHALLFVTHNNTDHDGHGPTFQSHMRRINAMAGLSISVYHNFGREVSHFRTHWWQCQGRCRRIIKRSMNRAPSKHDLWWSGHQRSCGGAFHKVKEPPGFKPRPPAATRHRALCDACHKRIVGYRHRCDTCKDFDLCDACKQGEAGARHAPSHTFQRTGRPKRSQGTSGGSDRDAKKHVGGSAVSGASPSTTDHSTQTKFVPGPRPDPRPRPGSGIAAGVGATAAKPPTASASGSHKAATPVADVVRSHWLKRFSTTSSSPTQQGIGHGHATGSEPSARRPPLPLPPPPRPHTSPARHPTPSLPIPPLSKAKRKPHVVDLCTHTDEKPD